MRRRFLLLIAVLGGALAAAGPPRARAAGEDPSAVDRAKQAFEGGKQAYSRGRYLAAALAFEEAYRLSPRAPILFSLAQAYRRLWAEDRDPATLSRAVDGFRRYLAEAEAGAGARRADAEQILSELEPALARLDPPGGAKGAAARRPAQDHAAAPKTRLMVFSGTRSASAAIDGGELLELPMVREVTPGPHKIRVEADGYFPEELDRVAVQGELLPVEVNLKERPAKLAIDAPEGAEIAVDGRPVGEAPLGAPLEVRAGAHFLAVTERGSYAFTRTIDLARGQELALAVDLPTTEQRRWSYYLMAGTGLLTATGVTCALVALGADRRAQEIEDQRQASSITLGQLDEYNDAIGRRDDFRAPAYATLATAAGLAVVTTLLYFLDVPHVEASSTP